MTLDDAIATLYAREINSGCETFWDGGIKVWIGDMMNGHHAEMTFSRDNMRKSGNGWSTKPRGSIRRVSSSGPWPDAASISLTEGGRVMVAKLKPGPGSRCSNSIA